MIAVHTACIAPSRHIRERERKVSTQSPPTHFFRDFTALPSRCPAIAPFIMKTSRMSLTETKHSEDMHARWLHSRRYVVMTRTVSVILLLTSGIMMHNIFNKSGDEAMNKFGGTIITAEQ
ncbi:MAG: hypothetical protein ACSHXB_11850 [Sulfitobacter sp.]